MTDLVERLRDRAKQYRTAWGDENPDLMSEQAASTIEALSERIAVLEKALKPFADFPLSGFDGPVMEVVPPWPENPATRIEPIFRSDFERARSSLTQEPQ